MKNILAAVGAALLLAASSVCYAQAQQVPVQFGNCSGTITTGGTAQYLSLPSDIYDRHGVVLVNIDATTGSGEPLWFSPVGTAAAATAGSAPLSAPSSSSSYTGLTSWFFPIGSFNSISVVAATSGHKFTCWYW